VSAARAEEPPAPKPPTYQVPKEWKAVEPASPLISARFQIGEGERMATVVVTGLQGNAGGLAANVNRWRAQVGLDAVSEEAAVKSLQAIKVDGSAGHVADVTGPDAPDKVPTRIRVVVVTRGEHTWFFKLTGPATLVGEQVPAFDGFIKSIRFEK